MVLIAARTDRRKRRRGLTCRGQAEAGLVAGPSNRDPASWAPAREVSRRLTARGRSTGALQQRHPAVVNVEAEKRDIERSIATETQRMAQTVKANMR